MTVRPREDFATCYKCGARIVYQLTGVGLKPYNMDFSRHDCVPKVKVYTAEERAEFEKSRSCGK